MSEIIWQLSPVASHAVIFTGLAWIGLGIHALTTREENHDQRSE